MVIKQSKVEPTSIWIPIPPLRRGTWTALGTMSQDVFNYVLAVHMGMALDQLSRYLTHNKAMNKELLKQAICAAVYNNPKAVLENERLGSSGIRRSFQSLPVGLHHLCDKARWTALGTKQSGCVGWTPPVHMYIA